MSIVGLTNHTCTQLALIGGAVHLARYEKKGVASLKGTHAERAKRIVSATLGWRAVLASFIATLRVGLIVSSKRSMLSLESAGSGGSQ